MAVKYPTEKFVQEAFEEVAQIQFYHSDNEGLAKIWSMT